jgi:hypothetical protein
MKVIQTMAISLRRLTEKVSQRLKGIKDGSEKIPPRRLFQLVLVLYVLGIFALVLAIHYTSPMQQVVRRYAGFHKYVGNSTCSPANATMYQYGTCTKLIECLFDPLDPLSQNDIAIGAALLGLFPTILILVGQSFLLAEGISRCSDIGTIHSENSSRDNLLTRIPCSLSSK